jgi:ribose transport system permease protein
MPKLLWREPIETTVITSVREDDAANEPSGDGTTGASTSTARKAVKATAAAAITPPRPKIRVKTLGDIAGRESGALIVLLVAVGALTLASPDFLTGNNLANLARQVAIFGILAIGQLMVILTGGIDLSVGSILGLAGAVTAQLLVSGVLIIPAILIGVVVGGVLGLANGVLVTRFKLPPFIATLGMLGIARGIVLVITDANTIQGLPDSFQTVANGTVVGIPNLLVIFVIITAIVWFVLNRTVFGRYVYAVGSNPEAARLAGVPVALVTTAVYVIAGVLAAVGGVLLTSRLGAGVPTAGTGFELQAIAACVIGGASLSGARGSAIGAACGAPIIGVLNNGGNLLAINAFYLQIAIGALVLVAVGFDQMNTRKAGRG